MDFKPTLASCGRTKGKVLALAAAAKNAILYIAKSQSKQKHELRT